MQILFFDGECQGAVFSVTLMRSGRADGRINRDIGVLAIRWPRLNIAPALTIRACLAAAASQPAGKFVEGSSDLFRDFEFIARLNFCPTIPPGFLMEMKKIRRRGINRGLFRDILDFFFVGDVYLSGLFFFTSPCSGLGVPS